MDDTRLTIYASLTDKGWQLVDNGGNILDSGQTGINDAWDSHDAALLAAQRLYPANSVWHGQWSKDGGWSIVIT